MKDVSWGYITEEPRIHLIRWRVKPLFSAIIFIKWHNSISGRSKGIESEAGLKVQSSLY